MVDNKGRAVDIFIIIVGGIMVAVLIALAMIVCMWWGYLKGVDDGKRQAPLPPDPIEKPDKRVQP